MTTLPTNTLQETLSNGYSSIRINKSVLLPIRGDCFKESTVPTDMSNYQWQQTSMNVT